jgi:hypothetical protein
LAVVAAAEFLIIRLQLPVVTAAAVVAIRRLVLPAALAHMAVVAEPVVKCPAVLLPVQAVLVDRLLLFLSGVIQALQAVLLPLQFKAAVAVVACLALAVTPIAQTAEPAVTAVAVAAVLAMLLVALVEVDLLQFGFISED